MMPRDVHTAVFSGCCVRMLLCAGLFALTPPFSASEVRAQRSGADAGSAPRDIAPIDLTGHWVSYVTEDWRWHMVTPAKGDYASIPITPAAKARADAWDPAADEAAGLECRSYGAAAIMRVPGRIRFSWVDDDLLRMEADAGTQTRDLHFDAEVPGDVVPSWQGYSVAEWQFPIERGGLSGIGELAESPGSRDEPPAYGSLKVVTTHLLPGYLRKNGVPYSADTVLTEHFDIHVGPDGEPWLVVTSVVHDPENLQVDWITSPNFKRDPSGRGWSPTPCSAEW